jgi:hypothetical protein
MLSEHKGGGGVQLEGEGRQQGLSALRDGHRGAQESVKIGEGWSDGRRGAPACARAEPVQTDKITC